jgi:glycosyltransferase involved in cell wall biosynthesis
MPKVSIITPIYCDTPEKVNWLNEMIGSVVRQTLTDWELILIDDKSPQSLDSVKQHATDNRLRWLPNAENFGPARTRNTAVAIAESDCILPLDSDDMLPNNETLEVMYNAWLMDKTKTIYGNIQLYKQKTSKLFERGKVIQLPHYSFQGAMNLEYGLMPVTTMHSKEAHYEAGGWKPELEHGREDLEYWIACGKAGFCGLKINHATLLYRKHEQSRDFRLNFELKELQTMQFKIKDMHNDVYRGEYPMACCGKGGSGKATANVDPMVISQQNQASADKARYITTLAQRGFDFPENELEWVSYQGPSGSQNGSNG